MTFAEHLGRLHRDQPVAYTDDPVLAESILRLAAVADVEIEVLPRVSAARGSWAAAPLILLGADAVADALDVGAPRRPGVLLVRLDEADIWQSAVRIGADEVMTLPGDDAAVIARLVDRDRTPGSASPVVVVTGGCGGAGASHLAVAIARAAANRVTRGVLLIDGDSLGGGIELLAEAENAPGLRWRDLANTQGRVPPDALRDALPGMPGLAILSHDREPTVVEPQAWEAILDAGSQGFGLTVVDASRDAAAPVWDRARLSILVVPADLRSVAAAAARSALLARHARDARMVVRHRRDSDLDAMDLATALELPIVGEFADAKPVSAERVAGAILASVAVDDRTGLGDGSPSRRARAPRRRSDRRVA